MSNHDVAEKEVATPSEGETCMNRDDELDVIVEGFGWFANAAQERLHLLKDDLKKADEPSWDQKLADALLELAIEVGAVVCAEGLATIAAAYAIQKAVAFGLRGAAKHQEGVEKIAKEIFKAGTKFGFKAGADAMSRKHELQSSDRFMEGQIDGVRAMATTSQQHFIRVTRHRLSDADACVLAQACTPDLMKEAADKQAETSRDAWVRYLAQSKLGVVRRGSDAPLTTNMTDDATRARVNEGWPGAVPAEGPDLLKVARGAQPGVLGLFVRIPFDERAGRQNGYPIVTHAYLAGVNDTVRAAYGNKSLEELHVPVRIEVEAGEGWIKRFPRFTINLDETGQAVSISPSGRKWLVAYHREVSPGSTLSDDAAEADALRQLISELRVHDVRRPVP